MDYIIAVETNNIEHLQKYRFVIECKIRAIFSHRKISRGFGINIETLLISSRYLKRKRFSEDIATF